MWAALNCSNLIKKRDAMKIRSNVKAGGINLQHNEKLANDNSYSIEQKKSIGKKLRLSKETIRILKDSDLKQVAGGVLSDSRNCSSNDPSAC
jgi:hypothetical protein